VFATEDRIYALKMTAASGGALTPLLGWRDTTRSFGILPDNRLFTDDPTPQCLIADIDSTMRGNEIVVNHWGDGNIWAFSGDSAKLCMGFPLKVKGRVSQPPWITDLASDGILDQVSHVQATRPLLGQHHNRLPQPAALARWPALSGVDGVPRLRPFPSFPSPNRPWSDVTGCRLGHSFCAAHAPPAPS